MCWVCEVCTGRHLLPALALLTPNLPLWTPNSPLSWRSISVFLLGLADACRGVLGAVVDLRPGRLLALRERHHELEHRHVVLADGDLACVLAANLGAYRRLFLQRRHGNEDLLLLHIDILMSLALDPPYVRDVSPRRATSVITW